MFEENSPPQFLITKLSQAYQGLPDDIELDPAFADPCREMREKAHEFENIINKIDKGFDYDLRELTSVDLIHISDWATPMLHAFHNIICSNEKGIIGDEYVIKFFMGMDPSYFDGIEQFEVKELGR